jgi:hypothetical protein
MSKRNQYTLAAFTTLLVLAWIAIRFSQPTPWALKETIGVMGFAIALAIAWTVILRLGRVRRP